MGEQKSSMCCHILQIFIFAIFASLGVLCVFLNYLGVTPLSPKEIDKSWRVANIVAHNGGGDAFPEDTLEAVKIAVGEYNADIVEVDVHLTLDGKLVCIHDSSLNRTTNGTGTVSSYTFEQLSQFDAAYSYPEYRNKGIKIPSLEQIVEYVLPHASVKMFIEIKPPASPEIITAVQGIIASYNLYDRVIVISFEPHTLYKLRKMDEKIATSLIVAGWIVSAGCKLRLIPSNYCNTLQTYGMMSCLDWMILKVGDCLLDSFLQLSTSVVPWMIGSAGLVISSNSTSPQEAKQFIEDGYFVDIWGINDKSLMQEYWNVGATVAPDTLVKMRE